MKQLVTLLLLLFSTSSFAQHWTAHPGPPDSRLGYIFNPHDASQIYGNLGDYLWEPNHYVSNDSGKSWQPAPATLDSMWTLLFHPSSPDTFWMRTWPYDAGELRRSDDGGQSWTSLASPPDSGTPSGLNLRQAGRLLFSFDIVNDSLTQLHRSEDLGESWELVTFTGLPDSLGLFDPFYPGSIAQAASSPNRLYLTVNRSDSYWSTLLASDEGGRSFYHPTSWEDAQSHGLLGPDLWQIQVNPSDPDHLVGRGESDLAGLNLHSLRPFAGNDSPPSWLHARHFTQLPDTSLVAVARQPIGNRYQIHRSTGFDSLFTLVDDDLHLSTFSDGNWITPYLHAVPGDTGLLRVVWEGALYETDMAGNGSRLPGNLGRAYAYALLDPGEAGHDTPLQLATSSGHWSQAAPDGEWELVESGEVHTLAVAASDSTRLYRGGWDPARSEDGGISWIGLPEPQGEIMELAVDPTDADRVYALMDDPSPHMLQVSEDAGESWTALMPDSSFRYSHNASHLAVQRGQNPRVWMGHRRSLFKAEAGSASFEHVAWDDGLLRSIEPLPEGDGLIVNRSDGPWLSLDGGVTFEEIYDPALVLEEVFAHPSVPGLWYAMTPDSLVQRATPGSPWTGVPGWPLEADRWLGFSGDGSRLYLAGSAAYASFWTLDELNALPDAPTPSLPAAIRLHPAHPNPFNASTTLRFELAQTGEVELAVFDLLGRRVVTLMDERRSAGEHHLRWDGRGQAGRALPSGLYLARLATTSGSRTQKLLLLK